MTRLQVESNFPDSQNGGGGALSRFNESKEGSVNAEHDNDITRRLLLEERKGLLSLAGESRASSKLSSAESGLRQQVGLHNRTQCIPSRAAKA